MIWGKAAFTKAQLHSESSWTLVFAIDARSCLFAKGFPFVESKDSHSAGRLLNDFATHNRAVLVAHEVGGLRHFRFESFCLGFCVGLHSFSVRLVAIAFSSFMCQRH
jgi:hypothetical protein